MRPFISLCMIVRNEEKVLERCLLSIANLVDEIIIVDTGSTDSTKELALKYTKNIYDFEWINDFSAARNFAAEKATGEWILVLDADEYVDEENFKEFIKQLKKDNGHIDAYDAKIINFSGLSGESLMQNFHDRIYKNNGKIFYYRRIHEQFKHKDNATLNIQKSNLIIFHSGYLNQTVKEKEKSSRNKELLDIEMHNGEKNAFDYFNFGNEYFSIGEYSEALDAYLKAYKFKKDFRLSWVPMAVMQIITCLINLKKYNVALNVINDAENIYSNSPEIKYLKGEIFLLRGQLEDARKTFLELVNNNENYTFIILRPDLKDQKPHLKLGEIFLYQKDYNAAVHHYANVLNINNSNVEGIKKLIYILNKFYTEVEITDFLQSNNLVNHHNINIYIKTCFDIGNSNLALSILEDFSEEHKLLYQIALLKDFCINGKREIHHFKDTLNFDILKSVVETNWINLIDLVLLRDYVEVNSDLLGVLESLGENNQINKLINLLSGSENITNLDEDLILYSLEIFLKYKKTDLCNVILDNIEQTDKSTIRKVAGLLFANEFKTEALQLYELCDWNTFNEQDFINIIDSLIETNNKDYAIELAKYAIIMFEEDFRFYKYVLENTEDSFVFKQTFQKAGELFTQSEYLESIISANGQNVSGEDKAKIMLGEQNKILNAFLETIDQYLINFYSLKKDEFTVCYPYISFINEEVSIAGVKFLLIHETKKWVTIEVAKKEEKWTLQNLKTPNESELIKKKTLLKMNYINKKPKILLGYRDFSGCNTLALYKSIPSYISDEFEVDFVKGTTDEFTQKALNSDMIVITNMEYNFESNTKTNEKIVIDTWHGFPLKNMFYTDPHYFNKNSIAPFWRQIDYSTSYSELYSKIVNKSIMVDPDNFVITGSPRNDFLFNKDVSRSLLLELLGKEDNGQKFIFYMPTFRSADIINTLSSNNLFGFKGFDLGSLENFLEESNYELIVKLHPIYKKKFNDLIFNSSRISMYPEYEAKKRFVDLYEVLSATDILITDYSSVYFDYLLLDKPIIFAIQDLKEYQEERGFCLEPFENWTPGPKVVNQEQLQTEIMNYEKDKDYYRLIRKEIRDKVYRYKDGDSSERVWNFISSLYC
ncbi:hypothetical protein B5V89_01240 [Heyndrickxia sporothermodurans]|uniref:CDP-glycerol glycerophosphotransferase family protein n=1 Tax=Heyndrickxia sporothermodurans TaxID=46224 RepID=UPI000D3D36C5|nr:CDP-glycerol glycerophosphotransferase family protein [Heyndrickxia sporothermodurans]PTY80433.1 hypothetical protein B5V89_01240 [Heyndrickxia sporothermodurans]